LHCVAAFLNGWYCWFAVISIWYMTLKLLSVLPIKFILLMECFVNKGENEWHKFIAESQGEVEFEHFDRGSLSALEFFSYSCIVLIVSSLAFVASPCLWGSSLLDCFLFFLLLLYFCLNKFVWCGVVNALIKGEIEMPVGLGPCDEWLNNTVCVWRFSWLVSMQVIGGDWTCGDVWRMKIWCHADGLRAVKGGSRLAFEGFEIVRCMSTVPDDTARERWWTVSWLSHKTKIPDVRCGGRGRRRGQLSIARRFRIVVRRDHGTPWC